MYIMHHHQLRLEPRCFVNLPPGRKHRPGAGIKKMELKDDTSVNTTVSAENETKDWAEDNTEGAREDKTLLALGTWL